MQGLLGKDIMHRRICANNAQYETGRMQQAWSDAMFWDGSSKDEKIDLHYVRMQRLISEQLGFV